MTRDAEKIYLNAEIDAEEEAALRKLCYCHLGIIPCRWCFYGTTDESKHV